MVASAPVCRTASATVLKTGRPSGGRCAALARRDAADDLRAVLEALPGVERRRPCR